MDDHPSELEPGAEQRKPGLGARVELFAGSLRAAWNGAWARRRERAAFRDLGEALAACAPDAPVSLRAQLEPIAQLEAEQAARRAALGASLERDRADYAVVHGWVRPLVIARGLAERAVVRSELRRAARARRHACVALGALAHASAEAFPPSAQGALFGARGARAEVQAIAAERDRLVAQLRPERVPRALPVVGREAFALAKSLARELRTQLFPRVPALAGMVVGWWIASTFTDSELSATLHSWGIGHGPRRAVRSETYRAMSFWLPIAAAALCSYASARFSALLERRYGRQATPQAQPVQPAPELPAQPLLQAARQDVELGS